MRSWAALNQAWNWAPKRNQVFSASLISRVGPIVAYLIAGVGVPAVDGIWTTVGVCWVSGGGGAWPSGGGTACAHAADEARSSADDKSGSFHQLPEPNG